MARLSINDYLDKITSFHAGKPKFAATIAATIQPFVDVQNFLVALEVAFDLDTAIGVQLDAVGERVGRSRKIPIPIPAPWFAWDDPIHCWDRAVWQGPYSPGNYLSSLDDDTYRRLLRAKILSNKWDGTIDLAQAILDAYFIDPASHVFVEDNAYAVAPNAFFTWDDPRYCWDAAPWKQPSDMNSPVPEVDMSITVGVSGKIPNIVDLEILAQGLIPIKPEGVHIDYSVTSVNNTALFGFDLENDLISGWDVGSWGVTPDYINSHPLS